MPLIPGEVEGRDGGVSSECEGGVEKGSGGVCYSKGTFEMVSMVLFLYYFLLFSKLFLIKFLFCVLLLLCCCGC